MKRITLGATAMAVVAATLLPAGADAFTIGTKATDGRPLCGHAARANRAPLEAGLQVATFNVLHSETDEGDASMAERLPLIADAIIGSGADIVGAQEVTHNTDFDPTNEYPQKHGSIAPRLAQMLQQRTGEQWSWCFSRSNPHVPLTPDVNEGGGNALDDQAAAAGNFPEEGSFAEGLAIFSRYPITTARFRRLTPRTYEAPACVGTDPFCPLAAAFDARQVLFARVITPRGGVDVFNTHLAHGLTPLSDTTKRLQMRQALAIAREWSSPDLLPDFLVGDFNSGPYSQVLKSARAAHWYDTFRVSGATECHKPGHPACSGGPADGQEVYTARDTRGMAKRIDYVLAKAPRGCALRVEASKRIGDVPTHRVDGRFIWPSDHYGFVSTVGCA